ncbi:hypothetical protein MUK71_14460 [Arthrobacter zhangbolii]|uniref:Uncharacterized protein n=1 Tax=Arthrobacter zhangbolii TaxID=2886936 RepID=A0A9X1M7M0_9MICC|nr:hypothetical protein [Arthrobacter zhangbolii]MCC3272372.1 hypothetical protein [Arthrobacter zhangbolii]UON91765.1 hypothetical protein MUK71_14460 [Arthrobacter zhangbolii]
MQERSPDQIPSPAMPPPPAPPASDTPVSEAGKEAKAGKRRKAAKAAKQVGPDAPGARKGKRIWLAVAGVVLLAGGAVGGHFLTDPTRSDEYAALSEESAQRQAQLEKSQSDYNAMKTDYNKLSAGIYDREKKVGEREDAVAAAETAVKARETAVTSAEAKKAANTITDGTWTVGKSISAGTYTTTTDVGSSCYWGIYRSGSNGDDIIENDIPGGGRPSVTISEGQDFKSSRCGKWEKQ